ncbi:ribosomal protein S13, partial [Ramicandelaber brevisporus]
MLYLLGVNLPDKKIVSVALSYFYGIGRKKGEQICNQLGIHKHCKLHELSDSQLDDLSRVLAGMTLENELRREERGNITRLRQIGSYRGMRHSLGLPVNGQRTKNNGQTAKRLN